MKTAIIKTGLWQDDTVIELDTNTKLVYLCLLTNPQRDLLPAFRCGDAMLSAYTGFNKEELAIARQQLIDTGRIMYEDGFYVFTRQDFVKPTAGRDSAKIYEREYLKLPARVKQIVDNIHDDNSLESTGTSTGTPTGSRTGVIDIDINKDINITKNSISYLMAKLLAELHIENLKQMNWKVKTFSEEQLLKWAADIDKINRIDGYEWQIVEGVIRWCQNDSFWKTNIVSGSKLRKQFGQLVLKAQVEHDNNSNRVVIAGQDNNGI